MSQLWDGSGMLPVMESPNLGIKLGTSSTDISTAAGLDPEPLPPHFTLPQILMWPPRGHRALVKEHIPQSHTLPVRGKGKGHDGANPREAQHTGHCGFPSLLQE